MAVCDVAFAFAFAECECTLTNPNPARRLIRRWSGIEYCVSRDYPGFVSIISARSVDVVRIKAHSHRSKTAAKAKHFTDRKGSVCQSFCSQRGEGSAAGDGGRGGGLTPEVKEKKIQLKKFKYDFKGNFLFRFCFLSV